MFASSKVRTAMLTTLVLAAAFVVDRLALADADVSRGVTLLREDHAHAGAWRVDAAAREALRAAPGRVRVAGVPLTPGATVGLELERFESIAPGATFVIGRDGRTAGFDPARVALFSGRIDGDPQSRAFLAVSDLGVVGQFDRGPGLPRFVLGPRDPARRGLANDDLVVAESNGFGEPWLIDPCGVVGAPGDAGRGAGGVASFEASQKRLVQVAIDTDYEFFSLFGDTAAANAYVIALLGAVSAIYQREFDTAVMLTYVRLWDTPNDLYNEPDPLPPFRSEWNANQGAVPRDVAQLLTGRRNLPYGGVAYVAALCGEFAYSVAGYLNGSFASTDSPDPGNWDLIVSAHELGHNCGTYHTHDYGLDNCAGGEVRRSGIMSYCHTVSGGVSNIDMSFHTLIRGIVKDYLGSAGCVSIDCDGNGVDDATDIALGAADANGDGILDACQDCDGDGVIDPVAIAEGLAVDLDANGVPDACQPDCNGNGVPDVLDIALGTSVDEYGDGVPDECEQDCDANGVADASQINADMTLDVDRNAQLDACQDCDGNGVNDLAQLGGAMNLWIAGGTPALVQAHGRSGAPTGIAGSYGGGDVSDVIRLPDGRVLVALSTGNSIKAVDGSTGASLGTFVAVGAGGLSSPGTMLLSPSGTLLVASGGNGRVIEYNATTGAFLRVLVNGGITLPGPFGMAIGVNGELLVTTSGGSVVKFDILTGAPLGVLVPLNSGGLGSPRGLLLLPDGSLLVASSANGVGGTGGSILRFNGTTGAFLGRWDVGGVTNGFWGLRQPWAMRLSADGKRVLVSNRLGSAAIHSYDVATGEFLRSFYVLSADVPSPTGFVELPPSPQDCNMNFTPDACDIASGRSADINLNGVPDECEGPVFPFGDLNHDGHVDGADLGLLLGAWGPCAACEADLDHDGDVDGADLGLLLGAWA
ncbi:MAG: M12 family metallo-peptidase [Phycisphaerales bacterium]